MVFSNFGAKVRKIFDICKRFVKLIFFVTQTYHFQILNPYCLRIASV